MQNPVTTLANFMNRHPERRMTPKDKLEGIDVNVEYKLIKEKKSKLSRAMRDLVVHRKECGSGCTH